MVCWYTPVAKLLLRSVEAGDGYFAEQSVFFADPQKEAACADYPCMDRDLLALVFEVACEFGPRLVAIKPGLGRDLVRDRLAGWGERCVYAALSGAFRPE